jgi:hypothetical protein
MSLADIKLGVYNTGPEPISTIYFINSYHQTVCLYVYSTTVAMQRLFKQVPAAANTCNNRKVVGRVIS